MKIIKQFENFNDFFETGLNDKGERPYYETHDDYVKMLYDKIEKIKQPINGFEFSNNYAYGYIWINNIYELNAKPYEEYNGIIITVWDLYHDDEESINIDKIEIELPKLTSKSSVNNVFTEYKKIISNITSDLNKRDIIIKKLQEAEFVSNFPIKLNGRTFRNLEIKGYTLNGISFLKIKTAKLLKIYDKIENEYPEVLSTYKYNL